MRRLALLSVVAACGGGSSEPTKPIVPASSSAIGPWAFFATGRETFKPGLRVFDANNAALSGIAVTFDASAGMLSAKSVVTDATGTAIVDWTPAKAPSVQTLTAMVPNTTLRATFTAQVTRSFVGRWEGIVNGAVFDVTIASQAFDTATTVASLTGFATYRATASSAPVALEMIFGFVRGDLCSIGVGLGTVAYTLGGNLQANDSTVVGYINGSQFADLPFTMTRR